MSTKMRMPLQQQQENINRKQLGEFIEPQTLTELRDWVMSAGDECANTSARMKDEG